MASFRKFWDGLRWKLAAAATGLALLVIGICIENYIMDRPKPPKIMMSDSNGNLTYHSVEVLGCEDEKFEGMNIKDRDGTIYTLEFEGSFPGCGVFADGTFWDITVHRERFESRVQYVSATQLD